MTGKATLENQSQLPASAAGNCGQVDRFLVRGGALVRVARDRVNPIRHGRNCVARDSGVPGTVRQEHESAVVLNPTVIP
jgi:hypothetical protein